MNMNGTLITVTVSLDSIEVIANVKVLKLSFFPLEMRA